jgi:cytochrome oxidase Cu insertion factor (SCO1/SenC/PrrC family)
MTGIVLLLGITVGIATVEPIEPPMGLGAVTPATPMPKFKLPAVNGEAFDSSQLEGKVVVVRFWATW